jgi:hypothetical protein
MILTLLLNLISKVPFAALYLVADLGREPGEHAAAEQEIRLSEGLRAHRPEPADAPSPTTSIAEAGPAWRPPNLNPIALLQISG